MSLDGKGTYSPPAPQFPAISNTIIYADDFNQIILDIATALSTAIFRDGQAAFTADQSLGGNKLTNVKNGTNPQDATTVLQVFTDPVFVATTLQGFKITGSIFQALMTTITMVATGTLTLTGTTLLDASASGEVRLPANTSVGPISASELATLDGITATTTELNKLHGATLSTAELNILAGALITTAELNRLTGVTSSVQGQLDAKSPIASPTFTGIPAAPTAAPGTATTQLATTAFVADAAFSAALPAQAGNSGKVVTTNGVSASWSALKTVNGNTLLGSSNIQIDGLNLLASLTPANGATSIAVTGLATNKAFLVIAEDVTLSATSGLKVQLSSDNGSSYGTGWTFTNTSGSTPNGFTEVFRTDQAGANKVYYAVYPNGPGNGRDTSVTGVIDAIQIALTAAVTFTGTGTIHIYGQN